MEVVAHKIISSLILFRKFNAQSEMGMTFILYVIGFAIFMCVMYRV